MMRCIYIAWLLFLIASCGGGDSSSSTNSNFDTYSSSGYRKLAGTWTPWSSKGVYDSLTNGENYYIEMLFSRYGHVQFYEMDGDFFVECFGNYSLSGLQLNAQLKCHDSNDQFYEGGFSSMVDSYTMEITSVNLQYLTVDIEVNESTTLYKNRTYYYDSEENIQAGIYEVHGIDNLFINISATGAVNHISENESSGIGECEINGYIKEDPDYGLTVQNPAQYIFIGAHEAVLSVSGCNWETEYTVSDNVEINQSEQPAILRAGYLDDDFRVEVMGPGNAIKNNGINPFWLGLYLVCDQLNNPTDYAENNYDSDICGRFY